MIFFYDGIVPRRIKQLIIQVPLPPDEYYAIKEESQHSGVPAAAILRDRAGLTHPRHADHPQPGEQPAVQER